MSGCYYYCSNSNSNNLTPTQLIVAAVSEELGDVPGLTVGVGMVAAAAAMARHIEREGPGRVVLVGTAGAYPGGPAVGSVVTASMVGMGSVASARGLGYVPRPPPPIQTVPAVGRPAVSVLSLIAITSDESLAKMFSEDWQVEHMEAFGVATACAAAGVPLSIVLGITNRVGPHAHAEWLANRAHAEAAARNAVRDDADRDGPDRAG